MKVIKSIVPRHERIPYLFAPYPLKVYFGEREHATLGRASFELARRIKYYLSRPGNPEMLTIGSFCETAAGTALLLDGEHDNNKIFNNALSSFGAHRTILKQKNINFFVNRSRGPMHIGSNVTLSLNAVIRSGVTIGDGAVIGAGAVVTKNVPPFAIVAGNPAKIIRYRFPEKDIARLLELRWWDWDLLFLMQHLPILNTHSVEDACQKLPKPATIPKADISRKIAFHMPLNKIGELNARCVGVEINGKKTPLEELPREFQEYVAQVDLPEGAEITFRANIFEQCGMEKVV